jgi:hypothetical protein
MNDIDEFLEVALALFLALTALIFLLTYLERTLSEPAKEPVRSIADRRGARAAIYRWWFRRRKRAS